MSSIFDDGTADVGKEFDQRVARTVLDMRRSLGVTVAELARASGLSHTSIEAIERGESTTRAERYDISVAMGWLSNSCLAKRLTRPQATPTVKL